jgi:hypothetical protein
MSPAPRRGDRALPEHEHGSSVYWYNLGCCDPACRAKGTEARRKSRAAKHARRRPHRFLIDGEVQVRMVHPGLHPPNSDKPNRHGTILARKGYRCDCPTCAAIHPTSRRLEA